MKKQYPFKHFFGTGVILSIIFMSAGTLAYWQGLIFVVISIVMLLLNYTLLRPDDQLLQERSHPGSNVKKWDKTILGLLALCTIVMYVVAGLDSGRYH